MTRSDRCLTDDCCSNGNCVLKQFELRQLSCVSDFVVETRMPLQDLAKIQQYPGFSYLVECCYESGNN